jgi:SET domain-containing protein
MHTNKSGKFTAYVIKKSNIHGNGVFANRRIKLGELIEVAIFIKPGKPTKNSNAIPSFYYKITPYFASFLNHSKTKDNMELVLINDKYYAIANKNIPTGTEITVNYDGATIPFFIQGALPHYIN